MSTDIRNSTLKLEIAAQLWQRPRSFGPGRASRHSSSMATAAELKVVDGADMGEAAAAR
jgi:hypothetical protein